MMDLYRARIEGKEPQWKCTGGYKFLYVDEFGTVKACSQVPLREPKHVLDTTVADLKANDCHKPCEKDCGVSCVIQTSLITANPVGYALRCVSHLLETRGQGVAYGGWLPARDLRYRRAPAKQEVGAGR